MKTPEDERSLLYDYQVCRSHTDLQQTLRSINANGYQLVTVTQAPSGAYTVFFERSLA